MIKYSEMFHIKGYDLESDIPFLTAYDLEEHLMISNVNDRLAILAQAKLYRPSPKKEVYDWLKRNHLKGYYIEFVRSELTDLKKVSQLSLPDENIYDMLEVALPGHRKRLERAVEKLRLELQYKSLGVETPVICGRWGKPLCLPQAKFDFLCVKAFLFSQREPHNKAAIDFMVDSGSDVCTVQEETLKSLNLDLLGPVYSCGIHGGNHTYLYKGRLLIGDQEMDIEVIGSNYDSVGSRVLRHFRHVIDGHRHIWLKGTYREPSPPHMPLPPPAQSVSGGGLPLSGPNRKAIAGSPDELSESKKRKLSEVSPASRATEPPVKLQHSGNIQTKLHGVHLNNVLDHRESSAIQEIGGIGSGATHFSGNFVQRIACNTSPQGNDHLSSDTTCVSDVEMPAHEDRTLQVTGNPLLQESNSLSGVPQQANPPEPLVTFVLKDTDDDIDNMDTQVDNQSDNTPMFIWSETVTKRHPTPSSVNNLNPKTDSDPYCVVHVEIESNLGSGATGDIDVDVGCVDDSVFHVMDTNMVPAHSNVVVITFDELETHENGKHK
ncbi:uncharacterized protein LOC131947720 isoform X2 [Physella acuta]|nr:uncharacterized protein LOC131947720 isoform X2 [Physella acuta]